MASTPAAGRTLPATHRASISPPRLRVRWDRVSVFVALVVVLATVVGHTVVVAVQHKLQAFEVRPPATEAKAAASPPAPATTVNAQPECPRPAPGVVRTAPMISSQPDQAQQTVALTFDDGPGPSTPEVLDVLHKSGVA